jgi:hypothetical protein
MSGMGAGREQIASVAFMNRIPRGQSLHLNPRFGLHLHAPVALKASSSPQIGLQSTVWPVGNRVYESKWGQHSGAARSCLGEKRGAHSAVLLKSSASDDSMPDTMKTVVIKKEGERGIVLVPDFRLGLSVLAVGLQLWWTLHWSTLGVFISIIGGFLCMQTARLRFRFTASTLDVLRVQGLSDSGDEEIADTGVEAESSAIRKETSRAIGPWKFSSIVNWELWWPGFPVLAYFKETQVQLTRTYEYQGTMAACMH